jgi:hypothetical protein
MLKRQRITHQTDSECHTTWTVPHGIITASNYRRKVDDIAHKYHIVSNITQSAHGTVYHTDSALYTTPSVHGIPHRQCMVYRTVSPWYTALSVHGIPHRQCMVYRTINAWYTTPSVHGILHCVIPWYTALLVHGIPHCLCMVYHTVCAWYSTNLWCIAQTIDRHQTAAA